jgi:2-dehydro-3-deoxygluconokinase
VLFGNEEDFTACLGFEVGAQDASFKDLDTSAFRKMMAEVGQAFPNLQVVATSLREVHTATNNDWGAILGHRGEFHQATHRPGLEILDRVGGGDGFASGVLYGLLELNEARGAVEYGAAHGALAMTTPGDTSMATLAEVKKLASGGSARVIR